MAKKGREQLSDLGPEELAARLLSLMRKEVESGRAVKRITTSPTDDLKSIRAKLATLKRARTFVEWRGAARMAADLRTLLQGVQRVAQEPKDGVTLVVAFLESSRSVFRSCDDSGGSIGNVYRYAARELFIQYAKPCEDKVWLAKQLYLLLRHDEYGIHCEVLGQAADYLPAAHLRELVDRFWQVANKETNQDKRWHPLHVITQLALQLKDPQLFEKATLATWPKVTTASRIEIASAYLNAGDAKTALEWVSQIPPTEEFMAEERDDLLLAIYDKLGDRPRQQEAAWKIFHSHRDEDTFAALLAAIGSDQRDRVIADDVRVIERAKQPNLSDVQFLIAVEQTDAADRYLLARREALDGGDYPELLEIADALEKAQRLVTVSVIYRALIAHILQRAVAKNYTHAVGYLRKLDRLAPEVKDWGEVQSHAKYLSGLRKDHQRKHSFWEQYR